MPYELLDFQGKPISFNQLNDKSFSCKHGESQEELFVRTFERLKMQGYIQVDDNVAIHPKKQSNPYHPDLIVNSTDIGELKAKASPLFIANKYGINPQFALTMDLKDSFHYSKYLEQGIDISIFIWVKWAAKSMRLYEDVKGRKHYLNRGYNVHQLAGIWKVKFSELRRLEQEHDTPIHWYREGFRQPPIYSENDRLHSGWVRELLNFEPRLRVTEGIKSIASKGYNYSANGEFYSSGDSSGSYVFDLRNPIFECLYSNVRKRC